MCANTIKRYGFPLRHLHLQQEIQVHHALWILCFLDIFSGTTGGDLTPKPDELSRHEQESRIIACCYQHAWGETAFSWVSFERNHSAGTITPSVPPTGYWLVLRSWPRPSSHTWTWTGATSTGANWWVRIAACRWGSRPGPLQGLNRDRERGLHLAQNLGHDLEANFVSAARQGHPARNIWSLSSRQQGFKPKCRYETVVRNCDSHAFPARTLATNLPNKKVCFLADCGMSRHSSQRFHDLNFINFAPRYWLSSPEICVAALWTCLDTVAQDLEVLISTQRRNTLR